VGEGAVRLHHLQPSRRSHTAEGRRGRRGIPQPHRDGHRARGRYYLTYHRYATRAQVEACYPQLPEFLRLKKKHDPDERFQSDWYRFYRHDVADTL